MSRLVAVALTLLSGTRLGPDADAHLRGQRRIPEPGQPPAHDLVGLRPCGSRTRVTEPVLTRSLGPGRGRS
jgi:hypothetical protein